MKIHIQTTQGEIVSPSFEYGKEEQAAVEKLFEKFVNTPFFIRKTNLKIGNWHALIVWSKLVAMYVEDEEVKE
ncbi:hypothetical protein LH506_04565 [Lapidilactobacillus dextrinicus]|uniref:hypothetical protein n=1 Tax=Lapidilactobacillus dextrinicus TaxID=51664 RepID=UPI00070D1677|nr:hypothetical protein [Lapidilactobacillus dextrinicus]QFG46763.1 hypothetical protein LH506_04565 [Lapidilactobacillus dextrinicus]